MSYGCHNRPPLRTRAVVQDGYFFDGVTRTPKMIAIPDPMSKDCRYSKDHDDPGCTGCKHKQTTTPLTT